jgi:hypothetical protein
VLNVPQAHELFWTHLIELLDDVRHVEPRFVMFGDSVSVGAMHDLHQTYHKLKKHFEHTR